MTDQPPEPDDRTQTSPQGDALLRPGKDYELRGSEIVEATRGIMRVSAAGLANRRRRRISELEEALRPFAALADEVNGKDTDYVPCSMLCGDFNRARKVLDHE